jgi:hypothetical protein
MQPAASARRRKDKVMVSLQSFLFLDLKLLIASFLIDSHDQAADSVLLQRVRRKSRMSAVVPAMDCVQ